MADRYTSFEDLAKAEVEGQDYQVRLRNVEGGRAVIIAPHGGGIEPGTSEIADAIADNDFSFYAFEGLKARANGPLHVTSTRFDEPRCLEIIQASALAVAIHGEETLEPIVYAGGRHGDLMKRISSALTQRHFRVECHKNPLLQGIDKMNICNRARCGAGVQLELSRGLRASFFESLSRSGRKAKTAGFNEFVTAVREAIWAIAEQIPEEKTDGTK